MSGLPFFRHSADPAVAPAQGAGDRVGVIDIGSNSVRFVIYDHLARSPVTVHNEKTICSIGRNVANTGLLYKEGCDLALQSLARYRLLADRLGVSVRIAVATAAARDALNGPQFVRDAEAAWGAPVRILTGEEEARLAGQGVAAALPGADGVVGDLGGGSLDMIRLKAGRTSGKAVSLPFGPLRLSDLAKGDVEKARRMVEARLADLAPFWPAGEKSFYAVGGIWRALARVDMERENYPLHVLQHYSLPRERALALCNLISRQGRKSLELMTVISKRRAVMLPFGAIVLGAVLAAGRFKDVVVCAGGLREGLIYDRLDEAEKNKDPLIDFAAGVNQRLARAPDHAADLIRWSDPLFTDETPAEARLRHAALYLCDIGWRRHPDYRATGSYAEVLNMPFGGADHGGRVFLATAVFHRYSGYTEVPQHLDTPGLLSREEEVRALRTGLAARLAFDLSGSAPGELPLYRLLTPPERLVLLVPKDRAMVADDAVLRRLKNLAAAMDRKGEIQTV